ncbi:hypothetical protein DE146DRAFT_616348 [Phaeosphaeria sp. MPI-PUGE-AT-0046c]|nr:hypothetical protein DE146DRAFT_616348 [Phaeosphaeria sp. MPI-PUGE-AT-0046c]
MPYLIFVPGCPRPYITNDPRIYLDARSWDWPCESRPYSDSSCNALRRQEDARFESDRRTARLEDCWIAERKRRHESMATLPPVILHMPAKHAKHDSVQSVVVEVRELDSEDDFLV